jgi:hypothetical protein
MGITNAEVVPHGFPCTFNDWGGELELSVALAHAVSDKVEVAYRRGSMLAKRHELMHDVQAFCDG